MGVRQRWCRAAQAQQAARPLRSADGRHTCARQRKVGSPIVAARSHHDHVTCWGAGRQLLPGCLPTRACVPCQRLCLWSHSRPDPLARPVLQGDWWQPGLRKHLANEGLNFTNCERCSAVHCMHTAPHSMCTAGLVQQNLRLLRHFVVPTAPLPRLLVRLCRLTWLRVLPPFPFGPLQTSPTLRCAAPRAPPSWRASARTTPG